MSVATIPVTTEEAYALTAFIELAMDCFGPGAGDVIDEFGEDRYNLVWSLANRAKAVTRG